MDELEQYSLATILSMWAAVSLPMALLAWVVGPLISPHLQLHAGITHRLLMIAGMTWQTVVALVVLRPAQAVGAAEHRAQQPGDLVVSAAL